MGGVEYTRDRGFPGKVKEAGILGSTVFLRKIKEVVGRIQSWNSEFLGQEFKVSIN